MFAALALFAVQVRALDVTTSLEVLPLGVDLDRVMLTPDYFFKLDDVAFYGFVVLKARVVGSPDSATWMPSKYVGLRGEVGINDSGSSGSAFGITLAPKIPDSSTSRRPRRPCLAATNGP